MSQVTPIAGYPSRNATGTAVATASVRVSVANDGTSPAQVAVCRKGEGGDYSVAHVFNVGAGAPAAEVVLTDQEPGTEYIVGVVNGPLADVRAYVGAVDGGDGDYLASIDSKLTAPISIAASSLPLPTGAATAANQTTANGYLSSIDGKAPALGQAVMAASSPVVIASNQTAVPVSGTITVTSTTANQGTPAAVASSWPVEVTDGTNVLGTSAHPLRTDPTGSTIQPVSGTVTANVGTTGGLALDATLTGGGQKSQVTDGTNSAAVVNAAPTTQYGLVVRNVPAAATAPSAVQLSDGSASYTAAKTGQLPTALGATTKSASLSVTPATDSVGTAGSASSTVYTVQGVASMTAVQVTPPAGVGQQTLANSLSVGINSNQVGTAGSASSAVVTVQGVASMTPLLSRISDGTNAAAIKAASTAATTTDPALVVEQSPNAPSLTATITSKSSSNASQTLLASNSARKSASFMNAEVTSLYLNEAGATATTSIGGYTVIVPSGALYELPGGANGGVVTGAITGIWPSTGSLGVSITERA